MLILMQGNNHALQKLSLGPVVLLAMFCYFICRCLLLLKARNMQKSRIQIKSIYKRNLSKFEQKLYQPPSVAVFNKLCLNKVVFQDVEEKRQVLWLLQLPQEVLLPLLGEGRHRPCSCLARAMHCHHRLVVLAHQHWPNEVRRVGGRV